MARLETVLDSKHFLDLPEHGFPILKEDRAGWPDAVSATLAELLNERPKTRSRRLEYVIWKDIGGAE